METRKNSGTVRGLSIATLVLTVISLLLCLMIVPLTNTVTEYLNANQDEVAEQMAQSLEASYDGDADVTIAGTYVEVDGLSYDMVALVAGFLYAVFAVVAILNAVVLVGSILAIRNAEKPDKLTAAFVLAIIGAVACFFMGAWVRCVLEIIAAVYISKVRASGTTQATAGGQPGAPTNIPPFPGDQGMPNVLR